MGIYKLSIEKAQNGLSKGMTENWEVVDKWKFVKCLENEKRYCAKSNNYFRTSEIQASE